MITESDVCSCGHCAYQHRKDGDHYSFCYFCAREGGICSTFNGRLKQPDNLRSGSRFFVLREPSQSGTFNYFNYNPTKSYSDLTAAEKEAKRLSIKNPEIKFFVVKAIKAYRLPVSEIVEEAF